MSAATRFRRLRAAVGNALVWGGAWSLMTFAAMIVSDIVGILPDGVSWIDGLIVAPRAGVIGAIAGASFSGVMGLLYPGKRLSDISWVRVGIGGGILTAILVPAFLQLMNFLSGDGFIALRYVLDDAPLAGVLGAIAAGGSLRIAQLTETALASGDRADHPDELLAQPLSGSSTGPRARADAPYIRE